MKFFRNGKAIDYNGGRTADTIVTWVEKKTGPPAVTLDSVDAAKKFIEDNEVVIVGFFADAASKLRITLLPFSVPLKSANSER